jgi:hypothetical protein
LNKENTAMDRRVNKKIRGLCNLQRTVSFAKSCLSGIKGFAYAPQIIYGWKKISIRIKNLLYTVRKIFLYASAEILIRIKISLHTVGNLPQIKKFI